MGSGGGICSLFSPGRLWGQWLDILLSSRPAHLSSPWPLFSSPFTFHQQRPPGAYWPQIWIRRDVWRYFLLGNHALASTSLHVKPRCLLLSLLTNSRRHFLGAHSPWAITNQSWGTCVNQCVPSPEGHSSSTQGTPFVFSWTSYITIIFHRWQNGSTQKGSNSFKLARLGGGGQGSLHYFFYTNYMP